AELAKAEAGAGPAETFRGGQDVFSITYTRGKPHFFINGYVSIPLDVPSEKVVGAFSSLFAPRRDRALVLGVGSGATAGTVALAAIKSTDYLLVCSPSELRVRDPGVAGRSPELAAYLRAQGIAPERLAYGLLSTRALDLRRDPRAPVNTMDHPELEFEIARLR